MSQQRMLVIDDEAIIRTVIRRLVEITDIGIIEAGNGAEGLVLAAEELPTVILLDVRMPGMTGLQVLERLKASAQTRHIPVLLYSGWLSPSDRTTAMRLGALDCIDKPFDPTMFLERVQSAAAIGATSAVMRAAVPASPGDVANDPGTACVSRAATRP